MDGPLKRDIRVSAAASYVSRAPASYISLISKASGEDSQCFCLWFMTPGESHVAVSGVGGGEFGEEVEGGTRVNTPPEITIRRAIPDEGRCRCGSVRMPLAVARAGQPIVSQLGLAAVVE